MKTGKELERLVAMLERLLAGTSASVEAPSRRLVDRDTGRSREHDVLITWDHGHHQIQTAIECRDRTRPVGVPDVEAFADKCDATGVHSRVIVSASGFRTTARSKAMARSITCMDLAEAEQFDWLGMEYIEGYRRHFGHADVTVMFAKHGPEQMTAFFDAKGNKLTEENLLQMLPSLVPAAEDPELEVDRDIPVSMKVTTPGWTATDAKGRAWEIDHLHVRTTFRTKKTISPLSRHRYTGGGRQYSFATAKAPIGDIAGSFVMLQEGEDGQTSIHWVRE